MIVTCDLCLEKVEFVNNSTCQTYEYGHSNIVCPLSEILIYHVKVVQK